jgi:DNA-binding PadR family transcriptional regulator
MVRFDDILLALVLRKPMSGYDAKKWLDTDGVFIRANADLSQIYRTFHRLQRTELVRQVRESRPAAPDAKVYLATAKGAQRIIDLAHEPYEPPARWQEPDFLVRFSTLGMLAPDTLVALLETELAFRRDQVAQFRNRDRTVVLQTTELVIDPDIAREINDDSHRFGADSTDRWIEWLEQELAKWRARPTVAPSGRGGSSASRAAG